MSRRCSAHGPGSCAFWWSPLSHCPLLLQAAGPNVLQKLGRVLREKASGDLGRVFEGTSKTRERLGVRCLEVERCIAGLVCQRVVCLCPEVCVSASQVVFFLQCALATTLLADAGC